MAEQAEADDVHEEDLDILNQGGDADDQDDGDQGEGQDAAEGDEDEDVQILFGDEAAPASEGESEPDLLRKLRAANREQAKELAALRAATQPKPVVIEVGEKPTLADVDYDEDKLADAIEAWIKRKSQAEQAEAQATKGAQARQAELDKDLARFQAAKTALGVRDFEEAKDVVVSVLSQDHLSAIVQASEDSAKVIYALGKHPAKLEALKAITNPVKFIAAVAKLEGTLKVTKTSRKAPELDTPVRGSAPLSSSSTDKTLAALEAKAAKSGNRTEVIAYKAKLKKQAK